jgi:hypothetical protein
LYTAIHFWSFSKSTKSGTAIRRQWTPTYKKCASRKNKFSELEIHHAIREHNVGADILSKLGSTHAQVLARVFVQELKQPSIKSSPQITTDTDPQKPDREVMMLVED